MEIKESDIESAVKILQYAKQDVNDVLPVTQKLYCSTPNGYFRADDNIKIIDFDERFIEKLEAGESLYFKGTGNEKLVLCTENETFEVKEGEISNSLMICPSLLFCKDVDQTNTEERTVKRQTICGVYHNYLELRHTFPRLSKLRKLLAPTSYSGPEQEVDISNKGYYLSELLENIQCSKEELLLGLKDISACCIDGKWRIISPKYESDMLSLIVGVMEDQGSNVICGEEAKKILELQVPEFVVDHILLHFASPLEESNLFVLKEDKVCRCFAEALLTAAGGTFLLDQFMKTWKASLPPGLEANLKYLHGLALIEKGKMDEDVICLFQEYNLPENIPERFRLLFKRKEKWTFDEIKPYIEKLATKSMNVNSLLTKFSRGSVIDGVRVFGARHAY